MKPVVMRSSAGAVEAAGAVGAGVAALPLRPAIVRPGPSVGQVPSPSAFAGPQLWAVDVMDYVAYAWRAAPGVLDAQEKARLARFRQPADRDRYVCAHVALRLLLGAYLRVPPADVELVRKPCPGCGGPHGRPAVPDDPVHFSLSHSGRFALLGFARTPVGVDVERGVSARTAVDSVLGSLHPEEISELHALAEDVRAAAFTRLWARKEAYLKALGTGLSRGLATDHIGSAAWHPAGWWLADVAVPDADYAAAVALRTGAQAAHAASRSR
ncbi:4'-phosphopantetheinyl transferase family protein [Streptomyces sp. NPDC001820]|uniref:4'-phosphopantetheinyl transferase family protein n=1 Tax=Streptomyces sp. NPDC001820 TaxID=3364613 RepID=UPI0036BFE2C1